MREHAQTRPAEVVRHSSASFILLGGLGPPRPLFTNQPLRPTHACAQSLALKRIGEKASSSSGSKDSSGGADSFYGCGWVLPAAGGMRLLR